MQITITDFVAGARTAQGLVVIIDVFRAFSLAAYAFARGAASMVPVAAEAQARAYREQHPDWLLIGERHARMLPGFDSGNSPHDLHRLDLRGHTLIHTTHAGTQGLTQAGQADEVITGALVNAAAIVRYIRQRQPAQVTLVRMGHEAISRCAEDDLCAELLRARLQGEPEPRNVREQLRAAPSAQKFFDPACDFAPEQDFQLCTELDRFDFVLRRVAGEPQRLQRVDVH